MEETPFDYVPGLQEQQENFKNKDLEGWAVSIWSDEVIHNRLVDHNSGKSNEEVRVLIEIPLVDGVFVANFYDDDDASDVCTHILAGPFPDLQSAAAAARIMSS